jgi:hypothetical protein
MRLDALPGLAVNLIGISPLTWPIRRLAARCTRTRSSKLPAVTSSTVTIEIHTARDPRATSVTALIYVGSASRTLPGGVVLAPGRRP